MNGILTKMPSVSCRFMKRDWEWRVRCAYCRYDAYFFSGNELKEETAAALATWHEAYSLQDVSPGQSGFGESTAWAAYEALQNVYQRTYMLAEEHARQCAAAHRRWHRENPDF